MPRKKVYRKKRTYRKKRMRRGQKMDVASKLVLRSPGQICADRMFVKMIYTQNLNFAAISQTQSYVFRGNSIFDPDYTGTGQQPTGYDQLATLYTRYRVHGSKMKAEFVTVSSTVPTQYVIVPTSNPLVYATPVMSRLPYARRRIAATSAGQPLSTLKTYMSTKKIFGLKTLGAETDYSAATGSNPAFDWYWHVSADSIDGASSIAFQAQITITYYVEWWNRVQLTAS